MPTLIRKASILSMDGVHGVEPFAGDVLVEGDRIAAIAPELGEVAGATVIDGRDRLVMPGLVNGHAHSGETFLRGRHANLPLELWMLSVYPILTGSGPSPRLLYLRSLLLAIESLKNGVTTLCDDLIDRPAQDLERLASVFSAYEDAGIRANVSINVVDRSFFDTLPYAREIVPPEVQQLAARRPIDISAHVDFCRAAFSRLHGRAGRLRLMIAPSAPQRCTPDLLAACNELARAHRVPLHTHVLETKTQAVAGRELYGKTIVAHMQELGLLHRGTTIAHSVWVTDDDMAMMGEAGCSVVHNCVSNQKLGSGIAPVRRLIDAGVNVALGTDGLSSNDTGRMFDVVRAAGLLHGVATPDDSGWVTAAEILEAATVRGARSALLDDHTGSLEVGKRADLVLLKTSGVNFLPLNDLRNQLVYCENGTSVELVMVNGEVVVRDGRVTRIDEDRVLAEIREVVPAYLAEHAQTEERNRVFAPYIAEINRRARMQDIGINRYAGDASFPTRRSARAPGHSSRNANH